MKKFKHLSLLLAAALIAVSISTQTETTKPVAKAQPTATLPSKIAPKPMLKMQPPTKLPAASKPVQPAKPATK